ncbi:hypothetical protein LI178_32685, partial [Enterocloster bolteae]|nr:hypothetical protein [Enterocloster bolteae]
MKTALNPNINKTQYKYYYTILPSDHDEKDYDIIESGTYIVMYHKGPYNQTYQAYPFMIDYAGKNHFEIES